MNQIAEHVRFFAALALSALAGSATMAGSQTSTAETANVAEQVARDAETAIRRIDPTTGGETLVVDPSLPSPYGGDIGADIGADEMPETDDAGLPPLSGSSSAGTTVPENAPRAMPRDAATRMIANPVVQKTPAFDPDDPFVIKSILPIEGTIRYGDWYWDESRAPKTGKLVMTVDLDARVISVFRDGHEIGTAVALLGTRKHPTPLGTFPILTKEKDNVSEKYNNAPMPWTLRLTWDGIAIHGSPVLNGYASHGCIGVPDPFAEKLFAIAKRGDRVVITRGSLIGVGDKIMS